MATTAQKWLIGCGIGCAVIVLVVVGLVTGAIVYVRGKFQPLQEASDSRREIVATLGAPDAYVPPADGAIVPDRMESFLSVRDALREDQSRLDTAFSGLDVGILDQRQPSFGTVLRTLNGLSNVIVPIGEYVNRRNRILLDKRMSLGEYAYIYSIAYHSWLGHAPNDGPAILADARLRGRNRSSGDDPAFTPESVHLQYRRVMLRLLENQLESIKDEESGKWRGTLKEEIDRLDRSTGRVAWQNNLPPQIEESLKPYRGRLEATYHPASNYFELLTTEEFSRMQWGGPRARVEVESEPGTVAGPVEAPEPVTRSGASGKGTGSGGVTYQVGSGVTAPLPIDQPAPAYTDEARKSGVAGIVTIQALIRKDGSVGSLKVIHGMGHGLDESALNTIANHWRFRPGQLNGAPVDVQATINISFQLR